ncbi:hypothetical protein [Nocardia amamiensis]
MKRYAEYDGRIPLWRKLRARVPFYIGLWWDRLRGPEYTHRRAMRKQL